MPTSDPVAFLKTVSVFTDLAEPHLVALALRLRERVLKKGEVLFREGDKGDELYLIREGTVVISKPVLGRVEQAPPRRSSSRWSRCSPRASGSRATSSRR